MLRAKGEGKQLETLWNTTGNLRAYIDVSIIYYLIHYVHTTRLVGGKVPFNITNNNTFR
jgi:hypothetical protein